MTELRQKVAELIPYNDYVDEDEGLKRADRIIALVRDDEGEVIYRMEGRITHEEHWMRAYPHRDEDRYLQDVFTTIKNEAERFSERVWAKFGAICHLRFGEQGEKVTVTVRRAKETA